MSLVLGIRQGERIYIIPKSAKKIDERLDIICRNCLGQTDLEFIDPSDSYQIVRKELVRKRTKGGLVKYIARGLNKQNISRRAK